MTPDSIALPTVIRGAGERGASRVLAAPLPHICSVHGEHAERFATVTVRPRHHVLDDVPRDLRAYLPGSPGPSWALASKGARRLTDPRAVQASWPLCARCSRSRLFSVRGGVALAALGATLVVLAVCVAATGIRGPVAVTALMTGLAALPLSVPLLYRSTPQRMFHATAAPDGSAVIVTDPHPDFAAAVRDGGAV